MNKGSHPEVRIENVSGIPGRETSTLAGEWGLSLHLESETAGDKHQYLVDFGYTPEILLRNFDLLGIETEKLDGLILSHSHRDHYGALVGFVDAQRPRLRQDVKLYTGGDLTFREKWSGSRDSEPVSMGALDGPALATARIEAVGRDHGHGLDGPFTTGAIARQSFERVLPHTLVEPTPADHFTEGERRARRGLADRPHA